MIQIEELVDSVPQHFAQTENSKEKFQTKGVIPLTHMEVQPLFVLLQEETNKQLDQLMAFVTKGYLHVTPSQVQHLPSMNILPAASWGIHEWSDGSLNLFPETWHFTGYVDLLSSIYPIFIFYLF